MSLCIRIIDWTWLLNMCILFENDILNLSYCIVENYIFMVCYLVGRFISGGTFPSLYLGFSDRIISQRAKLLKKTQLVFVMQEEQVSLFSSWQHVRNSCVSREVLRFACESDQFSVILWVGLGWKHLTPQCTWWVKSSNSLQGLQTIISSCGLKNIRLRLDKANVSFFNVKLNRFVELLPWTRIGFLS